MPPGIDTRSLQANLILMPLIVLYSKLRSLATSTCSGCPRITNISKLGPILCRAFWLVQSPKARCEISLWSRMIASMTSSQVKSMANESLTQASTNPPSPAARRKLTGRAFYENLGSPKMILAPMVDQSEFVRCFIHLSCRRRH